MIYYTIYKITNQIDGKIYVGSHKTKNLNDGYMGSGKYLRHAQTKYGIENFKKEILFVFETSEEMYLKEAEIVNIDFLATENTYNLKVGGSGGFDYVNSTRNHSLHNLNISKTRDYSSPQYLQKLSQTTKNGVERSNKRGSKKGRSPTKGTTGFKFTEESREKMKVAASGENSSQYGLCWISHELVGSKKCTKDKLPEYIDQGWVKGRNVFK
jgi:hypothetical protein